MFGLIRLTPAVRATLALVVTGWIWTGLSSSAALVLSLNTLREGQVWRVLTYAFASPLSLSSLGLVWGFIALGGATEIALGTTRFLRLLWGSIVLGGIASAACGLLLGSAAELAGFQAPFLAVLTAFCLLHWRESLRLGLPRWNILVSARFLFLVGCLSVLLLPRESWLACLSAITLAYLMVRRNWLMKSNLFAQESTRRRSRLGDDYSGPKVTPLRPRVAVSSVTQLEAQVNLILEKLRHEGMASLSPEEKALLDSYSLRLPVSEERS